MKSMASEMKALAEMFRAPDTFDHERAAEAAEVVWSHAESMPELFPDGSAHPPSRASGEIWDEWDDFVSKAKDLQEAAVEFGTAAESGAEPPDLKPHFDARRPAARYVTRIFACPDSAAVRFAEARITR